MHLDHVVRMEDLVFKVTVGSKVPLDFQGLQGQRVMLAPLVLGPWGLMDPKGIPEHLEHLVFQENLDGQDKMAAPESQGQEDLRVSQDGVFQVPKGPRVSQELKGFLELRGARVFQVSQGLRERQGHLVLKEPEVMLDHKDSQVQMGHLDLQDLGSQVLQGQWVNQVKQDLQVHLV